MSSTREAWQEWGEETLKAYRANDGNQRATARSLGVSGPCVRNRLERLITVGKLSKTEYEAYTKKSCHHESKMDGKDWQKEAEEAHAKLAAYNQLEANKRKYRVAEYKPSKSNAIAVAVASDWHAGEAVDPSDLPGNLNEYNPEVFKRRATQYFQRAVYLTDTMGRSVASIDTMVLAFLGDLMTGFLHEDQLESNHISPISEVLMLEETISAGIEYVLSKAKCDKIILPCCVGNHGRTTEKMRAKTSTENSYETLLYRHLARRWGKEKRLEWHIATGYQVMVKLWDYTIRFHHGDAVNYGGGVGGLTIPLRKAIHGWNTVQHANLDVCGHFHQLTDGGDFIVNGSLIGYNAYALRIKARYEPPQQAWFLVDHKRGKTITARIFTDAT